MTIVSMWLLVLVSFGALGAFGIRIALAPTCARFSRADVVLGVVCVVGVGVAGSIGV